MAGIATAAAIAGLAGAGVAIAGGVSQGLQARRQRKEAEAINPVRPVYEIPGEAKSSLGVSRGIANQAKLPGQALMEDKLSGAASSSLGTMRSASRSATDILTGAGNIHASQTKSLNDMAIAAAERRRQGEMAYGDSLSQMAMYRDKEFEMNQMVPYMNEYEKKEALLGAADQNLAGAFQGVSSGLSSTGGALLGLAQ